MQAPLQIRNDSDAVQTKNAGTNTQARTLVDNRPVAIAQLKLAEIMSNSPRVLQQLALSNVVNNSQRHQMSAFVGGDVKPQKDSCASSDIAGSARKKTTNTDLPKQFNSGIDSLSLFQQNANRSSTGAQLQKQATSIATNHSLVPRKSEGTGTAQPVVQRALHLRGIQQTAEMVDGNVNADALLLLINTQEQWNFVAEKDAVQTALMLMAIIAAQADDTYNLKNEEQLGLHPKFLSALQQFPDVDVDKKNHAAIGKATLPFDAANPGDVDFNGITRVEHPSDERGNEALIAAIKIRHMQREGGADPVMADRHIFIEGRESLDYLVGQDDRRYGLDPFVMKNEGGGGREPQTYQAWLGNSYENHVRTKKGNVEGKHLGKGHYSGLLDVSGIDPARLRQLVNEMTKYEMKKITESETASSVYTPPNLSLINAYLIEHNVAKYAYQEIFPTENNSEPDNEAMGNLFG